LVVVTGSFYSLSSQARFIDKSSCVRLFNDDDGGAARRLTSVPKTDDSRTQAVPLKENKRFTIATWNTFDLKLLKGQQPNRRKGIPDVKQPWAVEEMKHVVADINADLYIFQEVWGNDNLKEFNREVLDDQYDTYLIKGNDERGIQIGFAVRKGMNVDIVHETNRDLRWTDDSGRDRPAFSRDLPVLYLKQRDGSGKSAKDAPDLIVLGAHFKSKRTDNPSDPESNKYRRAHAERAAEIYRQLEADHPGTPIVLGGDFNGDIVNDPELQPLRDAMSESLNLMGDKLSRDEKVTHTFHPYKQRMKASQLDGLFLNKVMESRLVEAFVYHYKDATGKIKRYIGDWANKIYPIFFKQRAQNPSDHMPVVGVYDMTRS